MPTHQRVRLLLQRGQQLLPTIMGPHHHSPATYLSPPAQPMVCPSPQVVLLAHEAIYHHPPKLARSSSRHRWAFLRQRGHIQPSRQALCLRQDSKAIRAGRPRQISADICHRDIRRQEAVRLDQAGTSLRLWLLILTIPTTTASQRAYGIRPRSGLQTLARSLRLQRAKCGSGSTRSNMLSVRVI